MTYEQLHTAIMFNRSVAYILIVLMVAQIVADIIVFRLAILVLRRSQNYLELAAKHGQESDFRTMKVEQKLADESTRSTVIPPLIPPPEVRSAGGCSPAVLVPLTAVLVLVGWSYNRAEAAQEMRRTNEATALAWWAAERADSLPRGL